MLDLAFSILAVICKSLLIRSILIYLSYIMIYHILLYEINYGILLIQKNYIINQSYLMLYFSKKTRNYHLHKNIIKMKYLYIKQTDDIIL